MVEFYNKSRPRTLENKDKKILMKMPMLFMKVES